MKVALCDDNNIFLEEMKNLLGKKQDVTEVSLFSSPLKLIMDLAETAEFDVIFMDIDWNSEEKTGLEWGAEIYQFRPDIPIIFITGYNDRFAQRVLLADVNILGYMTKPVDEEILNRYLTKVKMTKVNPKYLVLSRQSGKISLNVDDIIHIESHNHKAIVCTETGQYEVYEKLSTIKERLTDDFLQCHKSFLVNMKWISTFEGKSLRMRNGKEIPISRTYSNKVREEFFQFLGKGI